MGPSVKGESAACGGTLGWCGGWSGAGVGVMTSHVVAVVAVDVASGDVVVAAELGDPGLESAADVAAGAVDVDALQSANDAVGAAAAVVVVDHQGACEVGAGVAVVVEDGGAAVVGYGGEGGADVEGGLSVDYAGPLPVADSVEGYHGDDAHTGTFPSS